MGLNKEPRRGGRRATASCCLLLLALALPAAAICAEATLRIGSTLPPVTLSGISRTTVRIPDIIKGKVAILHFWQIGCSSCRLEMPAMDELYGQYRRKGLEVLAVNVGQKRETVKTFAAELRGSYPILLDPEGKNAKLYGVTDLPRTHVIDRQGIIRYRILGGAT